MRNSMLRTTAAFGLAAAMLASLAVVAAAALGTPKPTAAQYQYKVLVCHRTHSKKKPFHTISVAAAAVPAHLKHGDTLGACPTSNPAATSGTSSKGHKGKGQGKGNTNTGGASASGNANAGGNGNGNGKGHNK
jgi:hypothetical protein